MSCENVTETPLSLGLQSFTFLSGSDQSKSHNNPKISTNKLKQQKKFLKTQTRKTTF